METLRALLKSISELSPRREFIMILLILAESMVLYIYAGFLLATYHPPYHPVPALLIFTLLLIAWQTPHLLETMRIWSPRYEIIMTLALLLTLLMAFKFGAFPERSLVSGGWIVDAVNALALQSNEATRPVWGMFVLTIYAWWRGRTRAEPVLDTAYTMFRWGIILAAGGVILAWVAAPEGARILETASPALVGFLMCALLAIAVSRQTVTTESTQRRTTWIWLAVFVIPICAIMLTTISTAGVLSRDLLDLAVAIVGPVFWMIGVVLRSIILIIALLAFVVIAPLLWLIERFEFGPVSGLPRIDLAPRTGAEFQEFSRNTLEIADPFRYLAVGAVLMLAIWLLVRFAFQKHKYWQDPSRAQRDGTTRREGGPPSLLARAGDWLRARFGRTQHDDLPSGPEWEHTRRVRRAYRRFLQTAHRNGIDRAGGQTPIQFANDVAKRKPSVSPALTTLTRHYNASRYSGRPAQPADSATAEDSSREIAAQLAAMDRDQPS